MDIAVEVNEFLIRKPDCFGAPHVRERRSNECISCKFKTICAIKAINMVFTIATGDTSFTGVTANKRYFVSCVGDCLPEDYCFPDMPLNGFDAALIKSCYVRSKHLLPSSESDDCSDLKELLAELLAQDLDSTETSEVMPCDVINQPVKKASSCSSRMPEPIESPLEPIGDSNPSKKTVIVTANIDEYAFPLQEEDQNQFDSMTDMELMAALNKISSPRSGETELISYMAVRDDLCRISIIMNQHSMRPPGFRPKRSLPNTKIGKRFSAEDTYMMLDRQIIDLHWLHCSGKRDLLDSNPEFADLFTWDEFDFDLAELLAKKGWTVESKTAQVLGLIPYEQWQMAFFRTRDVERTWRNAHTSMQQVIGKRLREKAVRDPRLAADIEEIKLLWLADKISIDLGRKCVGQVYAWLRGTPQLAPAILIKMLRRMRRQTKSK